MKPRFNFPVLRVVALAGLTIALGAGLALTQQEDEAALKARLKKLDAGPKTLDVTKYPPEQQAAYPLFSKKCSKCHTLARPINTPMVLPGDWERYIKRMVYKPDSKMTEEDGKKIFHFLVYDASVRKADSLRVHLASLPTEQREEALERIHALNPAFKLTPK